MMPNYRLDAWVASRHRSRNLRSLRCFGLVEEISIEAMAMRPMKEHAKGSGPMLLSPDSALTVVGGEFAALSEGLS